MVITFHITYTYYKEKKNCLVIDNYGLTSRMKIYSQHWKSYFDFMIIEANVRQDNPSSRSRLMIALQTNNDTIQIQYDEIQGLNWTEQRQIQTNNHFYGKKNSNCRSKE